jgi:hypothetical protein
MKKIITILTFLVTLNGFSQTNNTNIKLKQKYISLKGYKALFGKSLTKEDSLLFVIHKSDTLIPFPDDNTQLKGVKVKYVEKDSVFLDIYEDIVFKKYFYNQKSSTSHLKMRYWKDEIKIYFANNIDAEVKSALTKFANYLNKEVDSLKISYTDTISHSNFIIYNFNSKDDKKYDERIKDFYNDYYISWKENQRIYDCKLQLNSNYYKDKSDFISATKILFLKSLGHLNFTDLLPKESYLSSHYSNTKEFTEKDLEILKYHYSYGICKGTDLKTFQEQHKRAKQVLKETGMPYYIIQTY